MPHPLMRLANKAALVCLLACAPCGHAGTASAATAETLLTGYALTSWTDGDGVPRGIISLAVLPR